MKVLNIHSYHTFKEIIYEEKTSSVMVIWHTFTDFIEVDI